jgi:hypothetical protein
MKGFDVIVTFAGGAVLILAPDEDQPTEVFGW